ncbi:pseudouridine synthase, partial [Chloroflexota bacterium]
MSAVLAKFWLALMSRNFYNRSDFASTKECLTVISKPLLKVLAEAGIGSRRRLSEAIKQGRVAVNGNVVEDFRYPVNRETDRISLDGKPVDFKSQPVVCLILNKPPGVISTTSDERGRKTVLSLLPQKYHHLRLYPVGRLDKDSTGLLLLTNDGDLTYHLTHPKFEHEKEYLVQIDSQLKLADRRKLEHGIKLEEGKTHPAQVKETLVEYGFPSSDIRSVSLFTG